MKAYDAKKIFTSLLFLGFVSGTLCANLFSIDYITESGIFSNYFLDKYHVANIVTTDYFLYLIKIRVPCFIILVLLSCTKAKKITYIIVLIWTGFGMGMTFTAAAIKLGLIGVVFCILALTPHIMFYVCALFVALWNVFVLQKNEWEPRLVITIIVMFLSGVILESCVNPIIMQFAIRTLMS